jgi:peptidyl-prolyl cis-trans isomerase C
MNETLDFRLPGDEDPRRGGRRDRAGIAAILSALSLVGIVALLALRLTGAPGAGETDEAPVLDASILARRLEERGLRRAAAEAWEEAATAPGVPRVERARSWFRAGQLRREAGDFEGALAAYARSEQTETIPELTGEMDRARQECYRRLGNLTGLEAEIRARTSLPGREEDESAVVLAEIGPRRITRAELDRTMEEAVEEELLALRGKLPPERLAEEKKRLLGRLATREGRERLLDEIVTRELLVREAVEKGLAADPGIEARLERLREAFLARRLLESEIETSVSISESDLRDHYDAHREDFRLPAHLELRWIVCDEEDRAREAAAAIVGGRSFADCVEEFSVAEDRATTGGRIPGGVDMGAPIPGVGFDPAIQAELFALEPGEWTEDPIPAQGRWYLFEVIERTEERVRPFEEVRTEVERRKRAEKEAEAVTALLDRLREKHGVTVFRARLADPAALPPEEGGER